MTDDEREEAVRSIELLTRVLNADVAEWAEHERHGGARRQHAADALITHRVRREHHA